MLTAQNISKKYDGQTVLENIDLTMKITDHLGLIGINGAGKSTLLKILANKETADTGKVENSDGLIGYLPQKLDSSDKTVGEVINNYLDINEEYLAQKVLSSSGLKNVELNFNWNQLSGGQKTRLILTAILANSPKLNILILDEPTNNLDIENLDWLHAQLDQFKGGVIVTSHDRYFLDNFCNKIIELKDGEIKTYGGNFSFYQQQKITEEKSYERMYTAQQKQLKKTVENIYALKTEAQIFENKFSSRQPYEKKKASKSVRGAIVKEKRLEKQMESGEYLDKPKKQFKSYGIDIFGANPNGKLMVAVKDLTFSYGQKQLFSNISFEIFGSERLWLKGRNGSGKSTLLKCITEQLQPTKGIVNLGTNIKYGYFSQDAFNINPANTGIEELSLASQDMTENYRMAAHLHLTQEDLNKKTELLSSGQKIKLEFAKLLLANNNLLILDEPTNHLEIETREEIENALNDFRGAILVVSHDRYFIDKLKISKIVEIPTQ